MTYSAEIELTVNFTDTGKRMAIPQGGTKYVALSSDKHRRSKRADGSLPLSVPAISATAASTSAINIGLVTPSNGTPTYRLRRSPAGAGTWTVIEDVLTGAQLAAYVSGSLSSGQGYDYQAQAYDGLETTDWSASATDTTVAGAATLLFSENFNGQTDWHSGINDTAFSSSSPDSPQMGADYTTFPDGWYAAAASPEFAPSRGYPSGHEPIEILASNADKSRSGAGKSLVVWKDSVPGGFHGDAQLAKYFPVGHEEMFVSFWITFQPGWTPDAADGFSYLLKLFRMSAVDAPADRSQVFKFGGSDGHHAPMWFWDYYGPRNKIAWRADPQESNYTMDTPAPVGTARTFLSGTMSLNFTSNIRDLDGDGTDDSVVDSLFNLVNGEPMGASGEPTHEELWGTAWRKIEFYVKMNSAPGAMDGIAKQWMDGQLILSNEQVPWMGTASPGGIKWNYVSFGGNTNFDAYPATSEVQEWRAYDDIEIWNGLPGDKL